MSPDNRHFWEPGIKKEENSTCQSDTVQLVDRRTGMYLIPRRYAFHEENDIGPKVGIVAMGSRQVPGA